MEHLGLPLFGEPDQEVVPVVSVDRSHLLTQEKLADELNNRQFEAVVAGNQYLLILAGAGSGKTRVITYKIAWLIERGTSPYRILALTFTNKAAREMRERAESLGSISSGSGLWISTFHSACLRILRRYHKKIGYPKDFNVLDQADQERLLKHCIKLLGLEEKEHPVRQVASRISKFKNEMKGAEEAASELHPIRDEQFLNIFAIYQQKLIETRNMDFDDLLGKTVELLRREHDVRIEYNNRFAHIMVDEFQDTNTVQYELITLLAGKETGITVVGDDDQSIYRWRGADAGNFARFERGYPKTGVVKLEQNYRSTKNILKAAHNVVSKNSGRKEKELWTQKSGGEKVKLTTTLDEIDEANEIAGTINKLVKIESVRLGDIAVFYRTNAQSRALEDVLRREGYPYQIFGGLKFYARAEIKDLLSYFRAVMNPNDAVIAFRRCVNKPPRGIGDVTVGRLIEAAEENGRTPLAMLDYLDDVAGLNAGAAKNLKLYGRYFGR